MAKTNRLIDIKVNGSLVLEECREFDYNGGEFEITVDSENEKINVDISNEFIGDIDNNAIAYAVALG